MVSQRLAKPSYPLDSLSSTLSVGAIYTRLWCNGSIRGSNPLGQSSNLWGRAITYKYRGASTQESWGGL